MAGKFFPLFVDVADAKIVIIGGGKVALRKARRLLDYGAQITLISREIRAAELYALGSGNPSLSILQRELDIDADLAPALLVVCATDDSQFNQQVVNWCRKHQILVNNATSESAMNARFACSLETDDYSLAISAHGDPTKAFQLKQQLQQLLQ